MRKSMAALAVATMLAAGVIALTPAGPAAAATPTCNSTGTWNGAWVPISTPKNTADSLYRLYGKPLLGCVHEPHTRD